MRTASSTLLYSLLLLACRDSTAPTPAASVKPQIVKGAVPVAPFVAEQLRLAPQSRTVVYVGADWCEPCRHFHRALQAGELDAELQGVRFVEYDSDVSGPALEANGYTFNSLPFFALPRADGRCSPHSMQGSVKGEQAVNGNILPRLRELLAVR